MPLIATINRSSCLFYTIRFLVETIFRREERWKKDGRCLSDVRGHAHCSPIATPSCKSRFSPILRQQYSEITARGRTENWTEKSQS